MSADFKPSNTRPSAIIDAFRAFIDRVREADVDTSGMEISLPQTDWRLLHQSVAREADKNGAALTARIEASEEFSVSGIRFVPR